VEVEGRKGWRWYSSENHKSGLFVKEVKKLGAIGCTVWSCIVVEEVDTNGGWIDLHYEYVGDYMGFDGTFVSPTRRVKLFWRQVTKNNRKRFSNYSEDYEGGMAFRYRRSEYMLDEVSCL
jgi:hypothetical protein